MRKIFLLFMSVAVVFFYYPGHIARKAYAREVKENSEHQSSSQTSFVSR